MTVEAPEKRQSPTETAEELQRIDVDELLAASMRLIDKMKALIETAQSMIKESNALVPPLLDEKNRSDK